MTTTTFKAPGELTPADLAAMPLFYDAQLVIRHGSRSGLNDPRHVVRDGVFVRHGLTGLHRAPLTITHADGAESLVVGIPIHVEHGAHETVVTYSMPTTGDYPYGYAVARRIANGTRGASLELADPACDGPGQPIRARVIGVALLTNPARSDTTMRLAPAWQTRGIAGRMRAAGLDDYQAARRIGPGRLDTVDGRQTGQARRRHQALIDATTWH